MSGIAALAGFAIFLGSAHYLLPRDRFVTFYLVSALSIGIGVGIDLPNQYRLVQQGTVVQAEIVRLDCGNHGYVNYRFQAGAQMVDGRGSASGAGARCEFFRVGGKVPVVFLSNSPAVSVIGSARSAFSDRLAFTLLMMLTFPGMTLLMYLRREQHPVRPVVR